MTIDTTNTNTKGRTVFHRGQEYYARLSDVEEPLRFRVQFTARRTERTLNAAFVGFDSYTAAAKWINANRELSIHEITLSDDPTAIQRIFLDIDFKKEGREEEEKQVMEIIMNNVRQVLAVNGLDPEEPLMLLDGSHSKKYGYHIVFTSAYIHTRCNLCFINQVKQGVRFDLNGEGLERYAAKVDEIIDAGVYKKNASLRVHLSPKPENSGAAVYKVQGAENTCFDPKTLVTYILRDDVDGIKKNFYSCAHCEAGRAEAEFAAGVNLPEKMEAALAALGALREQGITVRRVNGNFVELWTNHALPCYVCGARHENEHAFAAVNDSCALVFCRRAKLPNGKYMSRVLVKYDNFARYSPPPVAPICAEDFSRPELYIETADKYVKGLEELFARFNTIFLKSDMGSGKSHEFREMMRRKVKANPTITSVIVTYRCSLGSEILARNQLNPTAKAAERAQTDEEAFISAMMREKCGPRPEVDAEGTEEPAPVYMYELYSDIKERKIKTSVHPRIIIQYESLHRLELDAPVEITFIDEGCSLLEQTQSNLNKGKRGENRLQFENLAANSKKLLVADALLKVQTMKAINVLREDENAAFWVNRGELWAPHVQEIQEIAEFRLRIIEALRGGATRFVAVTRGEQWIKALIAEIKAELGADFPILGVYGGGADNEEIMRDVNTEFAKYKCVVASPAISAGISFDVVDHFDAICVYFDNSGPSSVSVIQSLCRVRHPVRKYIEFCDYSSRKNLPCSYEDLLEYEEKRLKDNCGEYLPLGIPIKPEGAKMKFLDHNNKALRFELMVKAAMNTDKRDIGADFRAFLVAQGATFAELVKRDPLIPQVHKAERKKFAGFKKAAKAEIHEAIAAAEFVSAEHYENLKRLKRLTAEKRAKLEKFQLARRYGFIKCSGGSGVDAEVTIERNLSIMDNVEVVKMLASSEFATTYYNAKYRDLTAAETAEIDRNKIEGLSDVEKVNARLITVRHKLISDIVALARGDKPHRKALLEYLRGEQGQGNSALVEFAQITEANVMKTANSIVGAYGYRLDKSANMKEKATPGKNDELKIKLTDFLATKFIVLYDQRPLTEDELKTGKPVIEMLKSQTKPPA